MNEARLPEALAHYRDLAARYDRRTRWIDDIRHRTIAALELRKGDAVLDVGCGTGWCLPYLARAVGAEGCVLGVDPSPEMLAVAAQRPDCAGLVHIDLQRATAEELRLSSPVDAILFSYTHDILRSRAALANIIRQARPGARVAATSTKLYAPWLAPMNWYLRWSHRGYITNFDGFEAPWSLLSEFLDDFRVATGPFTQHYIATGRVK